MEDDICGLSKLEIEATAKQFHNFWQTVRALNTPGYVMKEWKPKPNGISDDKVDEKNEIIDRDEFEAKVSEADLETVQLRYVPDYIRELKRKEEYWKKEFNYWGDLISKKNWKLYENKVKNEMIRNKTVLKNFDTKTRRCGEEGKTHFSQSLDPERVQRLVDYIKEKESDDIRFPNWYLASLYTYNDLKLKYIKYAVFSRYGDFRSRPSSLNLSRAAEENTKNTLQY